MFVGAINSVGRKFLSSVAPNLDGKILVIGCSGSFTLESVFSKYGQPLAIHSNDISLFSCMAGRWLAGQPLEFEIVDSDYAWLVDYLHSDIQHLAALMTLLNMLEYDKRDNHHNIRMWDLHRWSFGDLVQKTVEKLERVDINLASFYEGDVWDHFKRFADEPEAVFCCYAPTYAGGYERLYKRLDRVIAWAPPDYELLDDARRDSLLGWMAERKYLWCDDREIDGFQAVMKQHISGVRKTVYLYSNVIEQDAYFNDQKVGPLPRLPLAGREFVITTDSTVTLQKLKTTELRKFKDAFLGKDINHTAGMWAFAFLVDGHAVGFMEFRVPRYGYGEIYLLSDFSVLGTRYKRLSKLILMLVKSHESKKVIERIREKRTLGLVTTAFTDRPVSMKYRGVFKLEKRGETKDGQKFLNYAAEFNDLTWQETLREWLTKHGSKVWSNN